MDLLPFIIYLGYTVYIFCPVEEVLDLGNTDQEKS
jgi:hypothetical protein